MEKLFIILGLSLALWVGTAQADSEAKERWAVYYGDALAVENFFPFDLVVFDSEKHPPLRPLRNQKKTLLGYLSLGEAESYRPDFEEIKKRGLLLEENKQWPGHYLIDIRNPEWGKYVIEEKIPEILYKRFDGIMLDTLDTPLSVEKKYPGMREAAIRLLRAIRMHYPDIKIMLNRGFETLPDSAPSIDMLLAESILADGSDPKKPKFFDEAIYQSITATIRAAQQVEKNLKIYTLDYWDMKDREGIKAIKAKQRDNGFIPYVSTPDLQAVMADE